MQREDYGRAEANYRRLIEVDSKARGENHPFVASEIHRLGRALGFQERYEEALAEYERAIAMHEILGSKEGRAATGTAVAIGVTLIELQRLDEAETQLVQVYDRLVKDGPQDWIERYGLRPKIANLLVQRGRPEEAAKYAAPPLDR